MTVHEYGLMEDIVGLATEEARRAGGTAVTRILLDVGELSFASKESLGSAFLALSPGTVLEGAEIVMTDVVARLRCSACGFQGSVRDAGLEESAGFSPWLCPSCGSPLTALEGGGLVLRAGIQEIHKGQMEAALSLGMTPARAMQDIILPQAVRLMLPPISNFSIVLLKDTSLVSSIAAPEIMFYARNLRTETFLSMHIYLIVAVLYLAMTLPMSRVVARLERARKAWH